MALVKHTKSKWKHRMNWIFSVRKKNIHKCLQHQSQWAWPYINVLIWVLCFLKEAYASLSNVVLSRCLHTYTGLWTSNRHHFRNSWRIKSHLVFKLQNNHLNSTKINVLVHSTNIFWYSHINLTNAIYIRHWLGYDTCMVIQAGDSFI